MGQERKATMLRIELDLYASLQALAQRDNRSVNQQIVYYLREALRRESRYQPPADQG